MKHNDFRIFDFGVRHQIPEGQTTFHLFFVACGWYLASIIEFLLNNEHS